MSISLLSSLIALAGVHLLAVASPGPAFVATVQLSMQQSRRVAVMHSLGLGLAAVVWAVAAMLGLQAAMRELAWLYRVLQFAGGVYLVYIGVQAWRHAKCAVVLQDSGSGALSGFEAFRRGFGTNIANPKVMVFFASIFAALMNLAWPGWVRLMVVAIIAVDEAGWYSMLAVLLSTGRAQAGYRRLKARIDRAAGSLMILFGGKLIGTAAGL